MAGNISLKNAIKQRKLVFVDELYKIAETPGMGVDDSFFTIEYRNFLKGKANVVYRDPSLFFDTTHFTEDLQKTLKIALSRLGSVREESYALVLYTGFGGGKTHTLVALHHLFESREVAINKPEIKKILKEIGLKSIPEVKVVALDGHDIEPTVPLWQEIADKIGDEDIKRMEHPPTATQIENMLRKPGKPVLILLDELVVYLNKAGIGSEISKKSVSFLHSLFVAAEATKTTLVVITIPDTQAYREEAEFIVNRIVAITDRAAKKVTPVNREDIVKILSKRFIKYCDKELSRRVAEELIRIYSAKLDASETYSVEKLIESYPFHPELIEEVFFGRIGGSYDEFQRTRGILRIMAKAIVNLLRHVDELPESALMISAGEIDLSYSELRDELTDPNVFGGKMKSVVETDVANSTGDAHSQKKDEKPRFGTFTRIATAVYLYSLYYDVQKAGVTAKGIFKALGDRSLTPESIEKYLEVLYDEVLTHLFRHEATGRYYFKPEENPRALVRRVAREVGDDYARMHITKKTLPDLIRSTEFVRVNLFEKQITKENTEAGRVNLFVIDYETSQRLYQSLKMSKELADVEDGIVIGEVNNRIAAEILSITTPNKNTVVLLLPDPIMLKKALEFVKQRIACEKLKKERSRDKEFINTLKKEIIPNLNGKIAQVFILMYSTVGYLRGNSVEFAKVTSTGSEDKAPYTERVLDELVKKNKVIVDLVTKDYVERAIGIERQYQRFRELVETIAASPAIPYVPEKVLKESIISLVREGEVGVYRGELLEPEDVDAKVAKDVLDKLYFGREISRIGEKDYILKAEFAERLREAAEKKLADKISSEILGIMGDRNFMRVGEIIGRLPEYGDRDIVYAIISSPELVPYCGDVEALQSYRVEEAAEGFHVSEAEVTEECYAVKRSFAERFKVEKPGRVEEEKETYKKPDEVVEREWFSGIKVSGEGGENLKDDIDRIVSGIAFKSLEGRLTAKVKSEAVSFTATVSAEKGSKLREVLSGIADLSEELEYSIKLELSKDVEVDEDVRLFLEQLEETESEKKVMVRG